MVAAESEFPQLTVGSEVEVTSDEEGFKGAWYGATILEPFPKPSAKKRKVLVQYNNLVTEDGSEPLKEYVDPVHIRPLPPPDLNRTFEVNDAIDAFYQDGWWTGLILKDLGNSNFMVFSDNPPDIIESESSNLRRHLEWVHGKWVPSEKQKPTTGSIFNPGTAVEINIERDDSRGAWFPAIFIKEIDENIFVVKHISSKDDMGNVFPDELSPLKLAVASKHLRPTPPRYVERSYELLEKVEAFYNFAWRSGLVTKVLGEGRYLVFFKHANKDKEFSQSEVRPPFEWIDGKWVSGSKEVLIASDCQENLGNDCNNGDLQEVGLQLGSSGSAIDHFEKKKIYGKKSRKYSMELPTPSTESSLSNVTTPSTKKLKLGASKANDTDLQPPKKVVFKLPESPLSVTTCKVRKVVDKTPSTEAGRASETVGTGSRSIKRLSVSNWMSAKTKSTRKKQLGIRQMKLGELDNQTDDSRRSGARLKRPSVKYPKTTAEGKKETAGTIGMGAVIGLESPVIKGSDNENHRHLPDDVLLGPKKLLTRPSDNKSTEIKLQRVEGSRQKRKRGRPHRLVISERGNKNTGIGDINDDMAAKECHKDDVMQEAGDVAETNCSGKVEVASAGTTGGVVDDDQPLSTWIGRHCQVFVDETCKQVDKSDNALAPVVKESSGQVDKSDDALARVVKESSGQVDKSDNALALVVKESSEQSDKSDKEVKESRLSSGSAVNQRNEAIQFDSPAVNTSSNSVDGESERPPFVKSSPVWKAIESMEVFQVMPQNPHFLPLIECKEEYREGAAIGNMITFANMVEKASKLHFDDPRSAFDTILETLLYLEKHGFEVKLLQARLNEMLSIKSSEHQQKDELKDLNSKILQHADERNKYAGEMDNILEKIRALEEKHALIKAKHDIVDTELARLQTRSEILCESTRKAHIDFKNVAMAPWKSA